MAIIGNDRASEETESPLAPGPADPPQRILVVENEGAIRSFNAEVLRHSGYQVDTAEDGEAGWRALHAAGYDTGSYDLLITDNDMPKVTGVELLKRLRTARMKVPVIMASGTLPEQEPTRNPWLQPIAILLKPYTSKELLGTVSAVLRTTDSCFEPITPPPDWQREPSADGRQQ